MLSKIDQEKGGTHVEQHAEREDLADPDPRRWATGRLLFAVARRIERDWNAHLASWDLNHAGFPVLMHLIGAPLSQRALAQASGVTEQTMSRVVARLERSGYVTRGADPADRRRHTVRITEAGRTAGLAAARRRPAEDLATRGLDDEQIGALREVLLTMLRSSAPDDPDLDLPGPAGHGDGRRAPADER
ncbi:MarR family winged helix-turn-helix transcriptional regulator [Cellulosimicrobium arenosum]|uniref:Winged helix-turn-helix transcriptional regulator n=1 Tax=Cellulosimicrobium arenosum TaxID=2708133 RepID=A0A927G6X2_9MICO|nr:MarR family winged helix-turn-helix transcriptional regulator [Cellulosimicrobium arenosum]MBD8077532.1 winged helix-turn-helix transcriptional regulator [Cellulosimicrobium arenosum]